jgi:hypothetical protein
MKVSYMGDGKNQMIDEWIEKQTPQVYGYILMMIEKMTIFGLVI